MRTSIRLMFRPIQTARMNFALYITALVIDDIIFPVAQVLLGLAQKSLVNAIEFHDKRYMLNVYIMSAVIVILVALVNPVAEYFRDREVHKFMRNFRNHAMQKLLSLPQLFFTKMHSGDILTRIGNDLEVAADTYRWQFSSFFLAIFYGLGSVGVMFSLCWQLSLAIIVLAAIEIYFITKASVKIKDYSEAIQKKISSNNELFLDINKGIRFIRMFSLGQIMKEKYQRVNEEVQEFSITRNKRILKMKAISDLFNAINLIGVLLIGIFLYFINLVDLGSVMAFLVLQDGISYMFDNLSSFFPGLQQSLASISRLYEILDKQSEQEMCIDKTIPPDNDIRCVDLAHRYIDHSEYTIKNLTCKIHKDSVTTIIGTSGSGKTTFVKLLLGLYPVNKGHILIGDLDYSNLPLEQIRKHFAYVSQSAYLFCDTLEANIRCGDEKAPFDAVVAAAKASKAHDFINDRPDGYATMVYEHGNNFSGGQRQRIAIARAIFRNAPVIVLDEATSAMDSENEEYIHDVVSRLAEAGKTVVIITHRETAKRVSDYIIRIENGTVLEEITPA